MELRHIPVLLKESIDSLRIEPDGVYADVTGGGGGHSAEILKRLGERGRLLISDRDPFAVKLLRERFFGDPRVSVEQENFENFAKLAERLSLGPFSGILADLGVSSFQLDDARRGFSYHKDAPLDMRMSGTGVSAAELCEKLSRQELERILRENGEEKFAGSIAKAIVREREKAPIRTTLQLSEIIKEAVPAAVRRKGHPARQSFQALRIEVNGELKTLAPSLKGMFDSLKSGGILSVISFHSTEDRIVKQSFAELCTGCTCPPDFPVCVCGGRQRGELCFKFKKPSAEELADNPRCKSATLRAIRRL